jgi:hypothetical protein
MMGRNEQPQRPLFCTFNTRNNAQPAAAFRTGLAGPWAFQNSTDLIRWGSAIPISENR